MLKISACYSNYFLKISNDESNDPAAPCLDNTLYKHENAEIEVMMVIPSNVYYKVPESYMMIAKHTAFKI